MNEKWPRLRDLPEPTRSLFNHWLADQTRPWLEGLSEEDQDGYFPWDFEQYKAGKQPID